MPKCKLDLILDEPDVVHPGGGTISGRVEVTVDKDVTCKGLEVRTHWTTHGSGNIDIGSEDSVIIYQGDWRAGHRATYAFEVPISEWPPTYHGHHLNIEHFVEARANIPWAFDPKASQPFQMHSTKHEGTGKKSSYKQGGFNWIGLLFAFAALAFFFNAGPRLFSLSSIGVWFLGGIGVIVLVFWIIRSVLPKWALGSVSAELDAESYCTGGTIGGTISISPRKSVQINGIQMTVSGQEKCVSGSGSNRRTHRHTLYEGKEQLAESMILNPGHPNQFALGFTLPADAPPSIDLDDNEIQWSVDLRIDIPSWPDWYISMPIQINPEQ